MVNKASEILVVRLPTKHLYSRSQPPKALISIGFGITKDDLVFVRETMRGKNGWWREGKGEQNTGKKA